MGWGWLFLFAVLGPGIGLLLALVAVPVVICSLCVRNPRSGFVLSIVSLALSAVAVLMSAIMWMEFLSGRYPDGSAVNYADPDLLFYEIIAVLEAATLFVSLLSVARRSVNRRRMA